MKHEILPNGNLRLSLEKGERDDVQAILDNENLDEHGQLADLLDHFGLIGNAVLLPLLPSAIGALTDAPIVTDRFEHGDDGTILDIGNVWWHERYAVESFLEVLLREGAVVFQAAPENNIANREFERHAARAFFASAWANAKEEAGESMAGVEIMDILPQRVGPAATHAARILRMDMERENHASIADMMQIVRQHGAGDRHTTLKFFGHYAAMQAMGHGVGLRDAFGAKVSQRIKVPYMEFSSASLEKDYR